MPTEQRPPTATARPSTVRQSIDALIDEVEQTRLSDPPDRVERLERQIDMSHRNTRLLASNFDDMQTTLQQLVEEVRRLSESLRSTSPPSSPKATAKQQPLVEPSIEQVEEGLRGNNGYGLGGLGKDRVGEWKGEEH